MMEPLHSFHGALLIILTAQQLLFPHVFAQRTNEIGFTPTPAQSQSQSQLTCDFSHWHPRLYPAFHLNDHEHSSPKQIVIDGKLDEAAWTDAPWSEPFMDIQGPRHWSQPWFTTKVKLRYDDTTLYVGAYLEETEVWANVTHRNEVVFRDNDFEVFVDADASTQNYKEVEVNALNTTWNLWLNKPYENGGHENSTRVDQKHGFDMAGKGLKSATYVKGGKINDPSRKLHFWTVELALPLDQLALYTTARLPPAPNSYWRINFSRVEWAVQVAANGKKYEKLNGEKEENWVWSPQYEINMHHPEWWGYLQFRSRGEKASLTNSGLVDVPLDPEWSVRYVSFQFYYAQYAFKNVYGHFATENVDALQPFFTSHHVFACLRICGAYNVTSNSFHVRLTTAANILTTQYVATITDYRRIDVQSASVCASIIDQNISIE